jgi:hypothetical protein
VGITVCEGFTPFMLEIVCKEKTFSFRGCFKSSLKTLAGGDNSRNA